MQKTILLKLMSGLRLKKTICFIILLSSLFQMYMLEFDGMNFVSSDLRMDGTMIVLDSITNEDIDFPFEAESQQTYSFVPVQDAEDQEIIVVKKETIDINPEIFQAILYEAPMSITRLPRDQYPKGDGWQLLSDQDKEEPKIDPRWEKLNDFKLDDD